MASTAVAAGADYKQAFSTAGAEGKAAYNEGADARIQAFKDSLKGGSAPAGSRANDDQTATSEAGAGSAGSDNRQFNDTSLPAGAGSESAKDGDEEGQ
ncbi:hypothetical protein [Pseudomonas putida]|jgi:hypothetical protein|nr:hypothetical protein [Pseudomonas putida]